LILLFSLPRGLIPGRSVYGLKAQPRELSITYYDSDKSPGAGFADGIAIATHASVGQRTLTIAQEKALILRTTTVMSPHKVATS
jgi:hypothetical protein